MQAGRTARAARLLFHPSLQFIPSYPIMKRPALFAPEKDAKTGAATATPKVRVRVLCNSLGEGPDVYTAGQEFETTAERAAALGDSVQILK